MKLVVIISLALICFSASTVLADEKDFEPRMFDYTVKRASDIKVLSEQDFEAISSRRLFHEEYKKHVLLTMARNVQKDPLLKKYRRNSDIRIFYQILSSGDGIYTYKSSQGKETTLALKIFSRLDGVLNKCEFCSIPESQGIRFGGWVSLSELFELPSDTRILSKDFFERAMNTKKNKQDPCIIQADEHVPVF